MYSVKLHMDKVFQFIYLVNVHIVNIDILSFLENFILILMSLNKKTNILGILFVSKNQHQ